MNAVDVANAALMEVGIDPVASGEPDLVVPGRVSLTVDPWVPVEVAARAVYLGRYAADGPNYVVRCVRCAIDPWSSPCTRVADALRGWTCARGLSDG